MKKHLLTLSLLVLSVFGLTSTVKAQPFCQAGFTYAVGTTNPGGSVSVFFNDSSYTAGSAPTYSWTFSDGQVSTLENPVITFGGTGVYVACLTISSQVQGFVCTSTFCDSIYINVLPPTCYAGFGWQQISPGVVTFSGLTQNNASWTWDFGDGTTGSGNNPVHTYLAPGTYNACLTVVTTAGQSCSSCQTVLVTGATTCNALFTANQVSGTTTFNFVNQSTATGILNQVWSFGDGSFDYSANPSHTYANGGLYNVCLTIYDSLAGCSDTYCDSIYINTLPGCYATFGYQTAPSGTAFYGPAQGNVSWAWDFGDGSIATGQNVNHVYTNPGTYTACLTVVNGAGQTCTACQVITITGSSACGSNFAIYPDTLTPHTYIAYNLAFGTGQMTYVWSWGDGTSSNTAYPSHTYAGPGVYTICLTITDATGCTNTTCYQFSLLRLTNAPITINVVNGTTGVNSSDLVSALTVAPNPATDALNAQFNISRETSVSFSISSITGQNVYNSETVNYAAGSHAQRLDISNLTKGIYILQIISNGSVKHQKFVKQ